MNRYSELRTFASLLGIAIATALAKLATDWLVTKVTSEKLIFVIAIILVVAISQIARLFIERTIGNIRFIRRLYVGDQFIEGTWFAISRCNQTGDSLTVITVKANGASLSIAGENFSENVKSFGPFWSHTLVIEWPIVYYTYNASRFGRQKPNDGGFCQWFMVESPTGKPRHYVGFWADHFETNIREVEGWLIEDKRVLRELAKPDEKLRVIGELFERYRRAMRADNTTYIERR